MMTPLWSASVRRREVLRPSSIPNIVTIHDTGVDEAGGDSS